MLLYHIYYITAWTPVWWRPVNSLSFQLYQCLLSKITFKNNFLLPFAWWFDRIGNSCDLVLSNGSTPVHEPTQQHVSALVHWWAASGWFQRACRLWLPWTLTNRKVNSVQCFHRVAEKASLWKSVGSGNTLSAHEQIDGQSYRWRLTNSTKSPGII